MILCRSMNGQISSRYIGIFAVWGVLFGSAGLLWVTASLRRFCRFAPQWIFCLLLLAAALKMFNPRENKNFLNDFSARISLASPDTMVCEAIGEQARLHLREGQTLISLPKCNSPDNAAFYEALDAILSREWWKYDDIYLVLRGPAGSGGEYLKKLPLPFEIETSVRMRKREFHLLHLKKAAADWRRKNVFHTVLPREWHAPAAGMVKIDFADWFSEEALRNYAIEVYCPVGTTDGRRWVYTPPEEGGPDSFPWELAVFSGDGIPLGRTSTTILRDGGAEPLVPLRQNRPELLLRPEPLELELPEEIGIGRASMLFPALLLPFQNPECCEISWRIGNESGVGNGENPIPLPMKREPYRLILRWRFKGAEWSGEKSMRVVPLPAEENAAVPAVPVRLSIIASGVFYHSRFCRALEEKCRQYGMEITVADMTEDGYPIGSEGIGYRYLSSPDTPRKGLDACVRNRRFIPENLWQGSDSPPDVILLLLGAEDWNSAPNSRGARESFREELTRFPDQLVNSLLQAAPKAKIGIALPPVIGWTPAALATQRGRTDGRNGSRNRRISLNWWNHFLLKHPWPGAKDQVETIPYLVNLSEDSLYSKENPAYQTRIPASWRTLSEAGLEELASATAIWLKMSLEKSNR